MAIPVNMSKAGFEPMPEGNYILRVNEITVETSKKGNLYLKFKYVVVEPSEHAGRFIWDNASLSENGLWYTQQVLEALTGKPWRDENMEIEPNDLVGLTCKAVLYQDEYNGKVNNKIQQIMPHSETSFLDEDEDEPF